MLSTTLNSSAQSTYTMTGSWMQGGSNTIPAQYLGDFSNLPSTSATFTQTVNKGNPTVTFTSTPNPSNLGQTVTFTITAAGPAGDPIPTGNVSFTNGDGGSVALNNGTATITLSNLAAGSTQFTAAYVGDSNYNSAHSTAAAQVVNATPTGKIACYSRVSPSAPDEIYIMNADGSNRTQLTFDGGQDGAPSLSADGTKIVYTKWSDSTPSHKQIWEMSADGSGQTLLDDPPAGSSYYTDDNPTWSPDGTKVVFQSARTGWNNIYIINAAGTGLTVQTGQK